MLLLFKRDEKDEINRRMASTHMGPLEKSLPLKT